jgi:hypothetical protein
MHQEDLVTVDDATTSMFQTCFTCMRRVNRILIRLARILRRRRYGKAMLRLFFKKPSVVLESILRKTEGVTYTHSLPTDLSVIRDEITGCLITAPEEVVDKITQI